MMELTEFKKNLRDRINPETTSKKHRKIRNYLFFIGSGLFLLATSPLPIPGKIILWLKWISGACIVFSGRSHLNKSNINTKKQ